MNLQPTPHKVYIKINGRRKPQIYETKDNREPAVLMTEIRAKIPGVERVLFSYI